MTLLAWAPGTLEWCIIGFIGFLLFGKRLPGIARSIGGSFTEFKRGIKDGDPKLEEMLKDGENGKA